MCTEIKRPSGFGGKPFDNVIFTLDGIRLIDVGISALEENAGEEIFNRYVEAELKETEEFFTYMMEA